jgi:cell division protein FtsL
MTRWGRARVALIALAVVAILFLFVFPTRSYIAQRGQVADAQRDVDVLREQNEKLQAEAQELQTREAIERMAREQFHMVQEGERVYNVMPGPAPTTTTSVP